jgi:hypothetical protein
MAGLADEPSSYFIVPAPGLTGEGNVLRVSGEMGAYPGSVVPDAGNLGRLLPLQSGTLDDDAEPRVVSVLEAGGSQGGTGTVRRVAEWIWRYQSEANDQWKGTDDPRYFTRYQTPASGGNPGSDNCSLGYSTAYRRLLYVAVRDTVVPSEVTVRSRQVDADYDHAGATSTNWPILSQFTLRTAADTGNADEEIAPSKCGSRLAELNDGTMVLVLRLEGVRLFNTSYDYNVYHSADGGETWVLVAESILADLGNVANWNPGQATDVQFSLAASGSWLRLTWRVGGAGLELYDAVSSDRGLTWQAVQDATPPTTFDNGDASTPSAFYTTGSDDRGTWFQVCQDGLDQYVMRYAVQGGEWQVVVFSTTVLPAELCGLMTIRSSGWYWIFAQYSDGNAGATDGWVMRRSPTAYEGNIINSWQTLNPSVKHNAALYVCARPTVVWAGDRWAFCTANKSIIGGGEINLASYWEGTRGWNRRSLGIVPHDADFNVDTFVGGTSGIGPIAVYLPIWWNHWNMRQDAPWSGVGSLYTHVSAGISSIGLGMGGLFLNTTNAGSANYAQMLDSTEPWGGDATGLPRFFGSCFEFVFGVSVGAPVRGEVGIRLRMALGTPPAFGSHTEVELWVFGNSLEIYDVVGATVRDTLTIPGIGVAASDLWRIRVSRTTGFGAQLQVAVRAESDADGDWYTSFVTLTSTAVGVSNRLQWGVLARTTAGSVNARWMEASINNRDTLRQSGSNTNRGSSTLAGFSNPVNLLGATVLEGESMEVRDGLAVSLAGSGGALGDSFDLQVAHTYAAENVLVDSPRIQWRVPAPVNAMSSPNEFGGVEWTKNLSGATNTVTDNSQTNPFGAVNTASEVTYTRPSGGTVIFMRATGVNQEPDYDLRPGAAGSLAPAYRAWTFSIWVRNRSGFAVQLAMDVSDGVGASSQTIGTSGAWQKLRFTVSRNGSGGSSNDLGWLDIAITGYVGGTLVVLDLYGAKLTAQPELVLRHSDLVVNSGRQQLLQATDLAVFDCNARRLAIDTDGQENFQFAGAERELDLARYGTDDTPFQTVGGVGMGVGFVPSLKGSRYVLDRQLVGQYLYVPPLTTGGATNGTNPFQSIRVSRYMDLGTAAVAYFDQLDGINAADWWGGGSNPTELVVYGTSGTASLGQQLDTYIRIRIPEQEPPDGEDHFRIGSLVLGMRKYFGVPLEWSFTDNEQPNVTTYRTRSAVAWAYREGPPQRTLVSRFVGDWNDRWREELRYMQRELSYEVRPLALVLDQDNANEQVLLGRITSGNEQDNAMWWLDNPYPATPASEGVKRTAGDLSLTFVEEV